MKKSFSLASILFISALFLFQLVSFTLGGAKITCSEFCSNPGAYGSCGGKMSYKGSTCQSNNSKCYPHAAMGKRCSKKCCVKSSNNVPNNNNLQPGTGNTIISSDTKASPS